VSETPQRAAAKLTAPADPAAANALARRIRLDSFLSAFLETIPDMVLILDDERQTVAANRQAQETLGKTEEFIIGRRPGDVLGCVGVAEAPHGCGSGARCGLCGAVQAILASQRTGEKASREARILVGGTQVAALDLFVTARPATIDAIPLTVFILRDISDQKRRAVLENLFFHDVLNTAGGIHGLAEILADSDRCLAPDRETACRQGMARLSWRLIEEITHQRDMLAAERGEFVPRVDQLAVPALLREVCELYAGHPVAHERILALGEEPDCVISNNGAILRRVLGNLVKNALEATAAGGTVRVSCRDLGERVVFAVNNPGVMPSQVQLQLFQRSFSTKAAQGRGLGTYSVKLFVERHLRGSVGFTSEDPEGTTFSVTLPKSPAAKSAAAAARAAP